MKHNGSYLRQYLPWLGLLLGVDALAALLLWLADARAFAATAGVIVLTTVFLFACVRGQKSASRRFPPFCAHRTRHTNRRCAACLPRARHRAHTCSARHCARSSRPLPNCRRRWTTTRTMWSSGRTR